MTELHEIWKQKQKNLKDLEESKRDDIYPCREDIPAKYWGTIIPTGKVFDDVCEKDLYPYS